MSDSELFLAVMARMFWSPLGVVAVAVFAGLCWLWWAER